MTAQAVAVREMDLATRLELANLREKLRRQREACARAAKRSVISAFAEVGQNGISGDVGAGWKFNGAICLGSDVAEAVRKARAR